MKFDASDGPERKTVCIHGKWANKKQTESKLFF